MLLAVAAYFALFGGEYSLFELRHMRQEQAVERQKLDSIKGEVKRLEARRDSLMNDSATIERIARERFGMIRNGERLYRFADAPDSARGDSAREDAARGGAAGRDPGRQDSAGRSSPGTAPRGAGRGHRPR